MPPKPKETPWYANNPTPRILEAKKKELGADRPERETIIGHEDLLNLQIALGTARTIEEFVEMV